MTDQNAGTPSSPFLPSLGAGRILADTFSLFFAGLIRFFPVGVAILFVAYAIVYLIFGDLGQNLIDETGGVNFGKLIVANLITIIGSAIFMAVMILAASDYKNGHGLRIGGYLQVAAVNLLPIMILQIGYGIGVGLGLLLLIIPGLYLMAMWAVYLPAIVLEQAGFSGLSRSADLTKNYRWSILGVMIVLGIITYLIVILASILSLGGLEGMLNPQLGTVSWFSVLIQSIGGALGGGLISIGSLVIFNRLKEIKDGGGVTSEFVEVFD